MTGDTGPDRPGGSARAGTWRELFAHEHRAPVIVLAGGVGLFATNTYVTTSLLPSAVREIGGERLYAWAMTLFVVAAVISSMLVSRALERWGGRTSYLVGFGVFAAGTAVAAASTTMPIMLVGRGVQGLAAGLLAGLGFAVLRLVLPERLWQRAVALMSAMWGVGNLLGPVIGGFFAQFGIWRGAFVLLAAIALGLAVLTSRALPVRERRPGSDDGVPWAALTLLAVAALLVSIASIASARGTVASLLAAAAVTAGLFVWRERRTEGARVLPAATYRGPSPLRWIYLAIGVMTLASTVETFVPLFGQELGGMAPLTAGFLGAAVSWGWTVASISSSSVVSPRGKRVVRVVGPLCVSAGLVVYGLLQTTDPSPWAIVGWFGALFLSGCGIGMAMAHWLTAGLKVPGTGGVPEDDAEAAQVSAGMNTAQLIATAFGSALAGLLVSLGGPSPVGSARTLGFGYAMIGVVAVLIAVREFAVARRHRALLAG
ncbi:MAG: MFS transporter [Gordonia sp. (in: high G+C Gram-positive bacteria)]|uniref:MFS transporter n=1 Tax=Gordonia sp. (in: high G+C Gram-positive bacteria) TaxID=84139 RepID=UPI0039E7267F